MRKLIGIVAIVLVLSGCSTMLRAFMGSHDMTQIHIGMSQSQVVEAIGYPSDVNRTTTAASIHEQWVYTYRGGDAEAYLYFDDGMLTAIQN